MLALKKRERVEIKDFPRRQKDISTAFRGESLGYFNLKARVCRTLKKAEPQIFEDIIGYLRI